ncbi:GNAT family N-acetyltransferase [Candidatus Saccharibacteria bacterium]|nr:GNAT family N-acetyltransferase [Candidatus Saccharibacteria bacterium]
MNEVTVRLARPEELSKVQDLNHELFLSDNRHLADLNTNWPYQEVGKEYFRQMIAGEIGVCFVAEIEGKLVGYLAGCIQRSDTVYRGKRAEVENMFVDEAQRSRGVGSKLIEAFYDWCRQYDVNYVMVTAFTNNDRALSFYQKQGFSDYSTTLWHKL